MKTPYRAAIFSNQDMTGPDNAELSDDELIAEALEEAYRADIIGEEYPRVTKQAFLDGLYIGDYTQ